MKKILLLISIMPLLLFQSCASCSSTPEETDPWKKASKCCVMVQYYVNQRLTIPDDADYDSNVTIEPNDTDKSVIIWGKVKAKNNFGVMIPHDYKAKLIYKGGDWSEQSNWKCEFIDIN